MLQSRTCIPVFCVHLERYEPPPACSDPVSSQPLLSFLMAMLQCPCSLMTSCLRVFALAVPLACDKPGSSLMSASLHSVPAPRPPLLTLVARTASPSSSLSSVGLLYGPVSVWSDPRICSLFLVSCLQPIWGLQKPETMAEYHSTCLLSASTRTSPDLSCLSSIPLPATKCGCSELGGLLLHRVWKPLLVVFSHPQKCHNPLVLASPTVKVKFSRQRLLGTCLQRGR